MKKIMNRISKRGLEKIILENKKNLRSIYVDGEELYRVGDLFVADNGDIFGNILDGKIVWGDMKLTNREVLIEIAANISNRDYISNWYRYRVSNILVVDTIEKVKEEDGDYIVIGDMYSHDYLTKTSGEIEDIGEFLEEAYEIGVIDDSYFVDEEEAEESGFAYYSINGDLAQNIIIIQYGEGGQATKC